MEIMKKIILKCSANYLSVYNLITQSQHTCINKKIIRKIVLLFALSCLYSPKFKLHFTCYSCISMKNHKSV